MADLSFSAAQKALLLGAFFPVFTPFQVVAGPLVQIFGAKRLLSLNLGGMAALLLLLPSTASIGGTWAMATCLAGIGVCQGVLVPGQGQLKRNWLTDGPERVWALRIMGLGGRVGYTLASVLVPFLAARSRTPLAVSPPSFAPPGTSSQPSTQSWRTSSRKWRRSLAARRRAQERYRTTSRWLRRNRWSGRSSGETFRLSLATVSPPPLQAKVDHTLCELCNSFRSFRHCRCVFRRCPFLALAFPFSVPAVIGATLAHFASNNMGYLFILWCPTYYTEVLGLTQAAAAAFISLPQSCSIWLPFAVRFP